ncbi:MAG: response regulator transcription factor [Bacteroidetes bacterium]|nr:response regulator transcription factor [Bacteroidota bacterium]
MKPKIKILIVDDHQIFIDGLKALLQQEDEIQIVGQALNGEDALLALQETTTDLLITDISMPGMSGIKLTQKVKEKYPEIKVLVISMHNDREIVSEILLAEADGYILKNANRADLMDAVSKIADHGTYYSKEILAIMLERVKRGKKQEDKAQLLSPRETEIVKLIMQENSSEQIAQKLFISKGTVDTHRKNILEKLQIKTLVGLCKFAFQNHLDSL